MIIKDLSSTELKIITESFNEAFADYIMRFTATEEYLQNRWKGAGVDYNFSFGAFINDSAGISIDNDGYSSGYFWMELSIPDSISSGVYNITFTWNLTNFEQCEYCAAAAAYTFSLGVWNDQNVVNSREQA